MSLYITMCHYMSLYVTMCGILSGKHIAIKGFLYTHYLTILYCIHMPCVFIINLYYTSKINIMHSFMCTCVCYPMLLCVTMYYREHFPPGITARCFTVCLFFRVIHIRLTSYNTIVLTYSITIIT